MTIFLRLLAEEDKAAALLEVCGRQRAEESGQWPVASGQKGGDPRVFEVAPAAFDAVPGKPFAYWVSEAVRETFARLPAFEGEEQTARQGLATADDFRFVRSWWEVSGQWSVISGQEWFPFAKGGAYSPFYADVYLVVNWAEDGAVIRNNLNEKGGVRSNVWMLRDTASNYFFRPGLTWPRRTNGLSFRAMPAGCIFADKGPAAFVADDNPDTLLALSALLNSRAFGLLVSVQLARTELAQSYEVGLIQQTPVPPLTTDHRPLTTLAHRAWSLKRTLDTVNETSHAFLLPAALRPRLGDFDPPAIEAELARIQAEIDAIAFDLYGFSDEDRKAVAGGQISVVSGQMSVTSEDDNESDDAEAPPSDHWPLTTDHYSPTTDHCPPTTDHSPLLSWAIGVAFGRFDLQLATGHRPPPTEPGPFDPLPAKSPGMLPDGVEPLHAHSGILVDDPGHPHDLANLVEEVLEEVFSALEWPVVSGQWSEKTKIDTPLTTAHQSLPTGHRPQATDHWPLITDPRRWLQRDFFAFHLQRYSKSRRKAPIYWPLATASGGYTLWVYYPSLTSQTLYTVINDFLEPKLKQVSTEIAALKAACAQPSVVDDQKKSLITDHRALATAQDLELELIELRDALLKLAPTYKPHHDDGVQISAAPLWPLFRHKPWQKVLKDTWAKLEKGDYDWAHLAMNYWPERVRGKCKTDKSLAIAHGLEHLYVEPEAAPKKARGRKAKGA